MQNDLDKRIQERAYEIWESEGQPQGRSEQHWAQARAEFADAAEAQGGAAQQETESGKPRKSAKRAATGAPVTGKAKSASSAKSAATGQEAKRPRKA